MQCRDSGNAVHSAICDYVLYYETQLVVYYSDQEVLQSSNHMYPQLKKSIGVSFILFFCILAISLTHVLRVNNFRPAAYSMP